MAILRRGGIGLTVLAGFGLTVTGASADGSRAAGPDYYELPSIWRGIYGGVHAGYADGDGDNGFVGGVQLGYNWQAKQIVYGVEGDISLTGAHSVDWLASVRGRLGYLIEPRLLVYGTAGLGVVNGDGTDTGFAYGFGVEGALTRAMSARLEYLSYNSDVNVIRAGLSFKLGP
jgi:opacity protein-like surface antigen